VIYKLKKIWYNKFRYHPDKKGGAVDMVSVKDFGAVGNGIFDDYDAIQRALDSGAREIIIPMGIYCISKTLLVHSNTTVRADAAAKLVMKSDRRRQRNEFLLSNADPANGNVNITILGGIWDGNNQAPENKKPDLFDRNGYSGAVLNFVHVDGLVLKDAVIANSTTFYVRMAHLYNFEIENIDFISDCPGANQDGLHFGGDIRHGTVRNIRALSFGQTNDDLIALNADDCIERVENLDLVRDAIEDVTFENLYAESCHTIVRILSVTAPIRNVTIKNVYAGFRCYAINADAARYCRTPLFKEEDYPLGVGVIEGLQIENFVCRPLDCQWQGNHMRPSTAIVLESTMQDVTISDFKMIRTEDTMDIPALFARNLTSQLVVADGISYVLTDKKQTLRIDDLVELKASVRFEKGEGIQKREENFAEEIAKMTAGQ
jgi:hypothetical protein